MSDGRSFASKEPLSESEETERRLKLAERRLDLSDGFLDQVKAVSDKFSVLLESFHQLSLRMDGLEQRFSHSSEDLKSKRDRDQKLLDQHSSQSTFLDKEIKNLKLELAGLFESSSNSIKKISESHSALRDEAVLSSRFEVSIGSLSQEICQLKGLFAELKQELSRSSRDRINVDCALQEHKALHKGHEDRFESLNSTYLKMNNQLMTSVQQNGELFDSKLQNFLQRIQKDLELFKGELLGSPASLKAAKEQLQQQLEGVSLDAANALLKAKNNDQILKIQEKKIENIQLVLKKIELKE